MSPGSTNHLLETLYTDFPEHGTKYRTWLPKPGVCEIQTWITLLLCMVLELSTESFIALVRNLAVVFKDLKVKDFECFWTWGFSKPYDICGLKQYRFFSDIFRKSSLIQFLWNKSLLFTIRPSRSPWAQNYINNRGKKIILSSHLEPLIDKINCLNLEHMLPHHNESSWCCGFINRDIFPYNSCSSWHQTLNINLMILVIQIISSSQYVHMPGSNIKYMNAIIWGVIRIDTQPYYRVNKKAVILWNVLLLCFNYYHCFTEWDTF